MHKNSFEKVLEYRNALEVIFKKMEKENKPTDRILYMIAALDNALKLLSDTKTVNELIEGYYY
jgi:hypothetical protein